MPAPPRFKYALAGELYSDIYSYNNRFAGNNLPLSVAIPSCSGRPDAVTQCCSWWHYECTPEIEAVAGDEKTEPSTLAASTSTRPRHPPGRHSHYGPHAVHARISIMRMANDREVAGYTQVGIDILITGTSNRIIVPTAEESKVIDGQMASDPDAFEMDETWFSGCQGHPRVRIPT